MYIKQQKPNLVCRRGHGVFDTAKLIDGHLYELEAHMERFLVSAGKAGITAPISIDQMARTILETAAASSAANGTRLACRKALLAAQVLLPETPLSETPRDAAIYAFFVSMSANLRHADAVPLFPCRARALLAVRRPRRLWPLHFRVRLRLLLRHGVHRRRRAPRPLQGLEGSPLSSHMFTTHGFVDVYAAAARMRHLLSGGNPGR